MTRCALNKTTKTVSGRALRCAARGWTRRKNHEITRCALNKTTKKCSGKLGCRATLGIERAALLPYGLGCCQQQPRWSEYHKVVFLCRGKVGGVHDWVSALRRASGKTMNGEDSAFRAKRISSFRTTVQDTYECIPGI